MVEKAFNALQWVVAEYKRTAITVLLLAFSFPFVTTGTLYLERTGYFNNVYQQEHADLKTLITRSVSASEANTSQLQTNHRLIKDGTYYQQRTCINTAQTREEKNKCVPER